MSSHTPQLQHSVWNLHGVQELVKRTGGNMLPSYGSFILNDCCTWITAYIMYTCTVYIIAKKFQSVGRQQFIPEFTVQHNNNRQNTAESERSVQQQEEKQSCNRWHGPHRALISTLWSLSGMKRPKQLKLSQYPKELLQILQPSCKTRVLECHDKVHACLSATIKASDAHSTYELNWDEQHLRHNCINMANLL